MLDANVILRYLLNDDERMASEAENIIKNMPVQVTIEIVAEVVYVLKGVYHIGRMEIGQCLLDFLAEVNTTEPDVLKLGIETFAKQNLDFPDWIDILEAYVWTSEVFRVKSGKTFDRKLIKLLAK